MSKRAHIRIRVSLDTELEGETFRALVPTISAALGDVDIGNTWAEILAWAKADHAHRLEPVVSAILGVHDGDHDPRWETILLRLLWPRLLLLCAPHARSPHAPEDYDDLVLGMVECFFDALRKLDLTTRSTDLAKKLCNDTRHRLSDLRKRERRPSIDANDIPRVDPWSETARLRGRLSQLQEWSRLGVISRDQYVLLVGVAIYGYSLLEFAHCTGINYETIRKRHQRAVTRISTFSRRTCPDFSPTPPCI